MLASDLITRFEQFAPLSLKWDRDPSGLQIGDPKQPVKRVLVTLDVRPAVVDEAIRVGADMIFAHHPVMFRPTANLDYQDPQKAMYAKIAAHHILVYAAHTNLDSADNGMNDWLAAALNLQHVTGLVPGHRTEFVKLTVTVPTDQVEAVQEYLTARPQAHLNRYALNSGEQFSVNLPRPDLATAVAGINQFVTPGTWDYEALPLLTGGQTSSMGRIGELAQPMTVAEFALKCKQVFQLGGLRLISDQPDQLIQRVAVLGGDGGKFYQQALQKGAQVYVTGDVYYHTGHDMLAAGLSVVDPGHHIESICIPKLTALFDQWRLENEWALAVVPSKINTDPFTFI
ncbi:Nif3-like dinuclear metal center hexameric protein [Lactobacillus sp. CBA3606]|uniref:Nif3-like dinuclear metal center hexameric protein n=1 Tax=Lactobacillus sp. CBA3606 TaxID=2099789 RepID=UPI000CFDB233|nr:Nif3-like dinuclear metal center hexameric protein [Lactobacillus sp. CBA3606]AVK63100.1 Nif3-like dinuclear metal center hexameric protein [Lactobacillus sp. CBA3606]